MYLENIKKHSTSILRQTTQLKMDKKDFPGGPVQSLRLCVSTAGGEGSTPDQGTKILHATQSSQNKQTNKKFGPFIKEDIDVK